MGVPGVDEHWNVISTLLLRTGLPIRRGVGFGVASSDDSFHGVKQNRNFLKGKSLYHEVTVRTWVLSELTYCRKIDTV
jgi:hypothetical protein